MRSVNDVPILALTFHSAHYDHLTLRRLAAEVDAQIKRVPEVIRPLASVQDILHVIARKPR